MRCECTRSPTISLAPLTKRNSNSPQKPEDFIPVHLPEETPLGIKDRLKPARDDIFLGKSVSQKEPLRVKDAALLHTEIKTKKGSLTHEGYQQDGENVSSPVPAKKKTGKSSAQDDKISWIND